MESIILNPTLGIVAGPSNAGKGTRLSEAAKIFDFELIVVSNLLKAEIKTGSELGKNLKATMEAGLLVSDDIVNNLVIDKIKTSEKPVILDGFPRTIPQAQALLESGIIPNFAINLQASEDILVQRASDRLVCSSCGETFTATNPFKQPQVPGVCDECGNALVRRKDDSPEVVKKRLQVHKEQTEPVIAFLADAGVTIYNIDNTAPDASKAFLNILTEQFA